MTDRARSKLKPGVLGGHDEHAGAVVAVGASGSVTTMAMANAAPYAPAGEPLVSVDHVIVAVAHGAGLRSNVGSEPAVSGSVIEKQLRSRPASIGA